MRFDSSKLNSTLIDLALAEQLDRITDTDTVAVLVELLHGSSADALLVLLPTALPVGPPERGLFRDRLPKAAIRGLVEAAPPGLLYKIWLNHTVRALTSCSMATVKADAALAAFQASGRGIVWAVADSGISEHSHFDTYRNLLPPPGIEHRDFTGGDSPLSDEFGHGTHVAGILAGSANRPGGPRGVAPETALLSLKVLDEDGCGEVSSLLSAIDYIQQVNDHGRRIRIHGLNLSLGYEFDPEWFACGASPLCVEVDRLVQSGVSVVVAAGNSGYGFQNSLHGGTARTCLALTINDPGNAELAVTVGSTHREMPHTYGVSYFSSKGPTGDGRPKPDLIAPGEKIVSAAAPRKAPAGTDWRTAYVEDSGTSMAAPHVSGAVAAFLSVRREFCGRPMAVKQILLSSATDLHRKRAFQGHGLLNLFQALQEK